MKTAFVIVFVACAQELTCTLKQECIRPEGVLPDDACPNPSQILPPQDGLYAPALLPSGTLLSQVCPFLSADTPLCCTDDMVRILDHRFKTLEVLFQYCPVCAVNIKTLWCQQSCNPTNSDFLSYVGTKSLYAQTFAQVSFKIGPEYACSLFESCKLEPYIKVSGVRSCNAFLQLLQIQQQNETLTLVQYDYQTDGLAGLAYACDTLIDRDLNGYSGLSNSSCAFCEASCVKPPQQKRNVFAGFEIQLVTICVAGIILFVGVYQLALWVLCRHKNT